MRSRNTATLFRNMAALLLSGGAGVMVAGIAMAAAGATAKPAGASDPVDFVALSGRWAGTEADYQTGECVYGAQYDTHKAVAFYFVLDVAADGSFTLTRVSKDGTRAHPDKWLGRFYPDLNVALAAPAHAKCGDLKRDYTINLVGALVNKNGRFEMQVEGTNAPCPEEKCSFRRLIRAKKDKG